MSGSGENLRLRRRFVLEGLLYILAEIIAALLVWSRTCPVAGFCKWTGVCGCIGEHAAAIPPFYILLCICALPATMVLFCVFLFSFSDPENIAVQGIYRPFWLIFSFAISTLLFIVFLFSALYRYFGILGSDPLTPIHHLGYCMYFSTITLTTVGYGDFHPGPMPASYIVASIEALSGYIILGVLVSSLSLMFRPR